MKIDLDEIKTKALPVIRRDMGVAGILIIISQAISSYQGAHHVSDEFNKYKEEDVFNAKEIVIKAKEEREEFFIRKIIPKLDRMNEQIVSLNRRVFSLGRAIKENYEYQDDAANESDQPKKTVFITHIQKQKALRL